MKQKLGFLTNLSLFIAIVQFSILSGQDFDPYALKAPIDTVQLGEYSAVRFNYVDSLGRITSITNELIIYKKGREVLSIPYVSSGFYDLCAFDSTCQNCYLCDINGDGKLDFLISYFTGGANCCFGAYLYSVDDTLKLIFRIERNLREFELIDLENDHIPEFVFVDETFAHWKDTYKVYLPRLIWRWDGEKYRLANFRFADYLLKDYGESSGRRLFWHLVIDYSYAGRITEADSIFMNCWPEDTPDRDEEFKAFKRQLENGEYWPEILRSNW